MDRNKGLSAALFDGKVHFVVGISIVFTIFAR